ncbi:hypothetical protein ZIOFF_031732 [Zingiber officinale]|uniref:Protein IQ-DOMAIN 1 n=1 Tax=Zingiber officinale TaxID=94328 RepID=A0A8J5GU83_ZINOF|nr:hypothetical protein ZIOFF_031732 [Zingiber officinale]
MLNFCFSRYATEMGLQLHNQSRRYMIATSEISFEISDASPKLPLPCRHLIVAEVLIASIAMESTAGSSLSLCPSFFTGALDLRCLRRLKEKKSFMSALLLLEGFCFSDASPSPESSSSSSTFSSCVPAAVLSSRMGSGDWLKTIIHRKKTKKATVSSNSQSNGFKLKNQASDHPNKLLNNGAENGNIVDGVTAEAAAAIRIQTSFRRFRARKTLRSLKRKERLQDLTHRNSVQKQISNTLRHVQLWSKIQAQIRTRRTMMVVEGRIRQKKQENQLKLEAKLQDLEIKIKELNIGTGVESLILSSQQVEWNGGTETKEEIIARIQQREEAAVKRERAMAYAFSHQWRASSGINQGPFVYELAKGNWEWSWVDKWIAAQPWETRPSAQSQVKPALKANKNTNPSTQTVPTSSKLANTDAKVSIKKPPKQPDEDTTLKIINTARLRSKCGTSKQEEQPSQGGELVT